VKDEQTGKTRTRTAFAGYARFTKKPTANEIQEVTQLLENETSGGGKPRYGKRSLRFGGLPWGAEVRIEPDDQALLVGGLPGGLYRWQVVGSTIYAAGMKNSLRLPTEKEIDKFFGSFEILDAKPEQKDLDAPPGWAEYKATGMFRAVMPQVFKKDDPAGTGNKYAGIPIVSMTRYEAHYSPVSIYLTVDVVRFQRGTSQADQQKILDVLTSSNTPTMYGGPKPTPNPPKKITWGGRETEELTFTPAETCVIRRTSNGTIAYVAAISSKRPGILDPDVVRVFFNSFAFDKE
jgi:hypothetical protein